MKRFFAFTVAAMLAGQAWAESSIGDSDWSILCLNGNYTAEIIYNGIRVIYEGENIDIWNMQLITPRWENIGQVGDAFKLEFDVLYEGEVDTAKLQIESGKNYYLDDYGYGEQVGNTQLVDEAGYPEISYRNSYVDVPNGEITHYECSYFLGEDGANVVQLEIDFGFNSGTYIFSNIQLTVAGEVVTEEDFTIEPKILQDALGFLQDSVIQYEKGEPKTKSIYGYDDRNNKILETVYAWNAMTKTWDNYCKYENAYDADNKHILANSYVWDRQSNAWQNSGKLEFLHNEEGNQIVGIQYYWFAKTNSWICKDTNYYYYQRNGEFAKLSIDSYKTETEYDANGNETLSTAYRWNPETNSWTGSSKTEYAYDANGNQTLLVTSYLDTKTNSWVGESKYEKEYDANGNETLSTTYRWNYETNSWVGESKYEKEYDANGNETLSATYRWNPETNSWVGSSKTEYAYDANGNLTLYARYNWNPETNSWVGSSKDESAYDANGNETLSATYRWNPETNSWISRSKTERAYDANGRQTLLVNYNWNPETNSWVVSSKGESAYDANGNRTIVSYNWNAETNSWVVSSKYEYEYDNGASITTSYNWDAETNSWIYRDKEKIECVIDKYGNYLLFADYKWNPETNSWIGGQRVEHDYIYYDDGRTYYDDYRGYLWKSDTWVLSLGCTSVFDDYDNTVISVQYRWNEEIKSRVIYGNNGGYYWEGGRDYSESTVINVELDSNRFEFVFKEMDTNTNELVKLSEYYFRTLATVNTEKNQSGNENQGGNQQGNGNQSGNENQGGNQQGNQNGNENQGGENNNQNGSGNQSGNENQGGNGNQNNENQESVANTGFSNGYKDGYSDGYSNGLAEGRGGTGTATAKTGDADYNEGYNDGYKDGYKEGFKEGRASTTVVSESAAAAVNIYAYGNTIVVENAQDEIRIYDAMGRLFCRKVECRVRTELQVNTAGVYIVKTGSVAKRVVIQF